MYFKKLEISGFKSFAEKTILHFEPGITAVVGPNGCGKSNIFDSIRWCLGEQSIKSLRGAKMEDVIFNGTETIPPQNVAEVSLTISNEAKILAIDYEEVTITRRLFRSGESEYLINKNAVRLKDINEMLMGTGIGAESYSLIEQGKIDLVISSKPEDRRLVFDEATGVSKYKAKKKEAMNKLEDTDNNLLRVNDIITEVKRQIGSIERQASKARRYKEVFDKLKDLELKYSNQELKILKSELAMLMEMSKKSHDDENLLNQHLQELDKKLIQQQQQLQEMDTKISTLKDEISHLENTNERNRQHIHLNQERVLDLNQHAELLLTQKNQIHERIAAHTKSIGELNEQLLSIHEIFLNKESILKEKDSVLKDLSGKIDSAQNEIKALKARIFELNANEAKINNETMGNASSLHTFLSRQRRLETEKIKTQEEDDEVSKNLKAIQEEIKAQKSKIEAVTARTDTLKHKKNNSEVALKNSQEELREFENEKLSLQSQATFLKELKLQYDSMPQAKNGLIEIDVLPNEKITGIIANARDVHFNETTKKYQIHCELKFISFDLENLEHKIEEVAKNIHTISQTMSAQEKDLMSILNEMGSSEEELQNERYHLTNTEAVHTNLSDNAKKIQDEISLIDLELAEINDNLNEARQKEETLKNSLKNIQTELTTCEEHITSNTDLISQKSTERENVLVEIAQLKTELSNQQSKEDSLTANLNFFKNAHGEDTKSLLLHDQEITSSQQKVEELSQESVALELAIKEDKEQIDVKTKEYARLSSIHTEEVNSADYTSKQILDLEEKMDKVKEDNHRYQMQEQEFNFKHLNIKNRILQTYNVDLDEMPLTEPSEDISLEQLNQEITTLKEKLESFGTVNQAAIEELEELRNRFDFLTQQQNDLLNAKDSLQKAIIKINRTTRKMFLETFQMVAEEFKNYFRLLFNGGEARLFLIDEEDVLESGIEIICRPPGKKLQNISLLSGGEKALSAIALIFALFKTKPSPFCVLDEIDAALDESNIDRFSRMLSEFSKTSQFICITHNKKTISRANVMYGITMERSGISKIVSVKLQDNGNAKTPPVTEKSSKEVLSKESSA